MDIKISNEPRTGVALSTIRVDALAVGAAGDAYLRMKVGAVYLPVGGATSPQFIAEADLAAVTVDEMAIGQRVIIKQT